MNYKLIYGIVHYDEDGNDYFNIITPMVYDARYLKTRSKIIENIKRNMLKNLDESMNNRLGHTYGDVEFRDEQNLQNITYIADNILEFNREHHLKTIGMFNYSEEDNDFYSWGELFETEIDFFKSKESELAMFNKAESFLGNTEENMYDLKIKNIMYTSFYEIYPQYDFDCRSEYSGGFCRIANNLYELLKKEQQEFHKIAEQFFIANYIDNNYNTREELETEFRNDIHIENDMSMVAINKNLHDGINSNKVCQRKVNMRFNDDNGIYMYCYIQQVPVVSYTGR